MPEPFTNLAIEREQGVATLRLDRPEKLNALHRALWHSIPEAVAALDRDPDVRVIVLAGNGKAFCAGIDLVDHASGLAGGSLSGIEGSAVAQRRQLYDDIRAYQRTASCFADTNKPVIAAVHGACLGGGMDLITACDIRLASADATFSVRETRIAMVADVGSLQRLPRLVGEGVARELIYTGRTFQGREAALMGLVNASYPSADALFSEVDKIARTIASKSPLALRGCKESILFTRDNPIATALNHVATWNAGMLDSDDFREAMAAFRDKRDPDFRD